MSRQLQNEIEKLIKEETVIGVRVAISGGPGGGGDSNRSRKKYAQRENYCLNIPRDNPSSTIAFTEEDLVGVELPHDDPLIIDPIVGNFVVERMLVDIGSSANVLYASTYDKLGLPRMLIQPIHTSLVGFTGHRVHQLGTAIIDVSFGTYPKSITTRV